MCSSFLVLFQLGAEAAASDKRVETTVLLLLSLLLFVKNLNVFSRVAPHSEQNEPVWGSLFKSFVHPSQAEKRA